MILTDKLIEVMGQATNAKKARDEASNESARLKRL